MDEEEEEEEGRKSKQRKSFEWKMEFRRKDRSPQGLLRVVPALPHHCPRREVEAVENGAGGKRGERMRREAAAVEIDSDHLADISVRHRCRENDLYRVADNRLDGHRFRDDSRGKQLHSHSRDIGNDPSRNFVVDAVVVVVVDL